MSGKMKYSIVIPCYKSSKTISKVVELTMGEMQGKEAEFILVNDASPDGGATFCVLSELTETYDNVTVIDLAKNAGQHNAVMAGLNYARGDYIIAMDDDMQTHPSQIHKLLEEMEQGWDIVYAYYPRKKHSWYRNLGSAVNFWTVRKLIGKPRDLKTSSFWVIRKFVRDYVIQYQNPYAYLQGLFLRTTQKITCVPVEHFERAEGTSNYNLKALIRLWSNVLGFSVVPLRMAIWLGLCFSLIGIAGAFGVFVKKIIFQASVAGWTSLMIAICFFSGIMLLFMGLIGEYVGRMFLADNRQPQYVVRQALKGSDRHLCETGKEKDVEQTEEKINDIGGGSVSGSPDPTGQTHGDRNFGGERSGELSGVCLRG